MKRLFLRVVVACAALTVMAAHATNVTVFAAASLTDGLKEVAAAFERQSGDKVVFNFAASGTLARQIQEGAPADIFFSADEARADALEQKGLLVPGSRKSLLGNQLVMVTSLDDNSLHAAADLTDFKVKRIALGELKTVPVGTYSKEYLEKLNLWTAVQPKVIPCENVRAVLSAVESGNVDAGIVYRTDAVLSKKVKIAFEVPISEGPCISYPAALVTGAPQPEAAKRFLAWLQTEQSRAVFKKLGFLVTQ